MFINTVCVLCERTPLEKRVYYDRGSWYAFLASPPYVDGHSILSVKKFGNECPEKLDALILRGLDSALADVVHIVTQHFQPKDILIASLRGRERHVHFHLIPLWEDLEHEWRSKSKHPKGHLFEYLGTLEKTRQAGHKLERKEKGWTKDEQRNAYLPSLLPHVDKLRKLYSLLSA